MRPLRVSPKYPARVGGPVTRPLDVEALKQLALLGGLARTVEIASGDLAELLGLSQQTASRRLIELSEMGLVRREMGIRRQRIRLTDQARALLEDEYHTYRRLFEAGDTLQVTGTVTTGLGEGRYYLSRAGYQRRFQEELGWSPYPGTLNLQLGPEAAKIGILRQNAIHAIAAFEAEGRTFGGVSFNPATIEGRPCATVLPHRSHHTQTLEVIAPVCLRDEIPCKDGDVLTVEARLSPLASPP